MKLGRRILMLVMVLALLLSDGSVLAVANTLTMPAALQIIDEEAFYGSTSIDKVVLSDNVTEIRARAFANSSLSEINLPDSLTFIDESAFDGPDKVTVTVNPGTYAYDWAVSHHYIDDTALRVSVTCSAEAAVPEESVTWTAEGFNGVEPYKYRFYLYCDGARIATRAYSTTNTYTYKFTKAGTYYVIVSMKDDDGEIVEATSPEIIVSLEALKIDSVVCDKETIRTTDTATWTAAASGGEQPYQYQFILKQGSEVVQTQDYSNVDAFSYTFETEGAYSLEVTAKDNLGAVSATNSVPITVALRPVEITSITANANSAVTESEITWTVETVAGKAPFTYDYEVKLDGTTKIKETNLSENSYTYNTEIAGSCIVTVTVTDAAGNTATQDSSAITITTKNLTIDAITTENEWVKVGDAINWTVEATGGVKPLRYAFDVYIDGEEMDGRSFNASNTYSYTPEEAGDYTARVRVRDAANTTVESESTVVHVYDPLTVNSVTADKTTITAGEKVVWSGDINGGKEPLKYSWEVYWGDVLEYVGTSTSPELSYAPMRSGYYTAKLIVVDADNESADQTSSSLTVNVRVSTPIEDFTFTVLNGTYCSVTGYTGSDTEIILPTEDNEGHIVQTIGNNAFKNNKNLVSVVISDSIETMGNYAFYGCTNLLSVVGGNKLTNIGNDAFYNCTYLKYYNFSSETATIGDNAFQGCISLQSFNGWIGITSIGSSAFAGLSNLTSISLPEGLTTIKVNAFKNCTSLESIHLPDSVTTIHGDAFEGCSKLASVNYPLNWTSKPTTNSTWSPFYDCPKLTDIVVPEGVTMIPSYAFYGMTSLRNIELPTTLTTIGNYAFYGCTGLPTINIPNSVSSIGDNVFYGCTGLTSVALPEGLTTINASVFYGCTGLTSVALPEGLTTIKVNAFKNCTSLESIHLPDSVTTIHGDAFEGCSKLASVNYPLNWTSKPTTNSTWSPFYDCPKLTDIVVPEGVTMIPSYAFYGMTSLRNIELPTTLTTIGNNVFYGCTGITGIYIGPDVISISGNSFTNHSTNLVIYGEPGSYAETYANENNIPFSTDYIPRSYGSLSGTVVDTDGNAIYGASVALTRYGSGNVEFQTTTGSGGTWYIDSIPIGRQYQATYSADGYIFPAISEVYAATESGKNVGTVIGTPIDAATINGLSLSVTDWTGGSEDAQRYFSVDSIGDWHVESVPDWATVYSEEASVNAASTTRTHMKARSVTTSTSEAVLILENNDGVTSRSGELIVSNGSTTATMRITQLPESSNGMTVYFTYPESALTDIEVGTSLTINVKANNFMYGVLSIVDPNGEVHDIDFYESDAEIPYTFLDKGEYTIYATIFGDQVWTDSGEGYDRPSAQTDQFTINAQPVTEVAQVATRTSDEGLAFIMACEGFSVKPYKDGIAYTANDGTVYYHWSYGYGRQMDYVGPESNPPTVSVTEEEALEIFKATIAERETKVVAYLNKFGITLNQNQFDALMSLCYNMWPDTVLGSGAEAFPNLLRAYSAGSAIPAWKVFNTFILFHHSDGADNLGLFYRRMNEATMFVYGTYAPKKTWDYSALGADSWFMVADSDGVVRRGLPVPADWYKDQVADGLAVSPVSLNSSSASTIKTVSVSGSTSWYATKDVDWITIVTTANGYGTGSTLTLQIDPNASETRRIGRVTVIDRSTRNTETIVVTQEGTVVTGLSASLTPFDIGFKGTLPIGQGLTYKTVCSGGDGSYTYEYLIEKLNVSGAYEEYTQGSKYIKIDGPTIVVRGDASGLYRVSVNVTDSSGATANAIAYYNVGEMSSIVYDAEFADGNYYSIDSMPTVRWSKVTGAAFYRVKVVELANAGTSNARYVIPVNGNASDEGQVTVDPSMALSKGIYIFNKSQTYRMWVGAYNDYGIRIAQSEFIFSTNPLQTISIGMQYPAPGDNSNKVPWTEDVTITWQSITPNAALNRDLAYLRANVSDNDDGVWLQSVKENCARISPEQRSFIISSDELKPGHHYTLWLAAFTKEGARFAQGRIDFVTSDSIWIDGTEITCNLTPTKASAATLSYVKQTINLYVSKDIKNGKYLAKGQAMIFMFEGAGASSDTTKRQFALCVVVRLNTSGLPEIVYENNNCSTIPDQPKYTYTYSNSDGTTYTQDCATVPDGVYKVTETNHQGKYGALNTSATNIVRFNTGTYVNGRSATGAGFNVHGRTSSWVATGSNESANSKGCILIGTSKIEQNEFMHKVLGVAGEASSSYYPKFSGSVRNAAGCIVIDRTQAKDYLIGIYGETGAKLVSP